MLIKLADNIIRAKPEVLESGSTRQTLINLAKVLCMSGMFYGSVMGSFAGIFGDRFFQVIFSAVKVPMLLMVTFGLSLPFFYVLNTLYGLRDDFKKVLRSLLATQACVTIILMSLSPLTALWYISFDNYRTAILVNFIMFSFAAGSSQLVLKRFYRPLVESNPVHLKLLRFWIIIYGFVGVQMGWVLRPFIGDPNSQVQFFRDGAWGNAYLELFRIIFR